MKEIHRLDEKLYHIATLLEGILISQNREFSEDHYGMSHELMGLWRKRLYRELFTDEEQADFARGLLEANPGTLGFASFLEAEQCVREYDSRSSFDGKGHKLMRELFDYVREKTVMPIFMEAYTELAGYGLMYRSRKDSVQLISGAYNLDLLLNLYPRPCVIIGGGVVHGRVVRISEINRRFVEDLIKEFLMKLRTQKYSEGM